MRAFSGFVAYNELRFDCMLAGGRRNGRRKIRGFWFEALRCSQNQNDSVPCFDDLMTRGNRRRVRTDVRTIKLVTVCYQDDRPAPPSQNSTSPDLPGIREWLCWK